MITSLLALIRPINSLMVGFAVLVGIAVVSVRELISFSALLAFLTGFAISSYSMIINDLYDIAVDRVNRPERPLPSGKVTVSEARNEALVFLGVGLISSLLLGVFTFLIAAFFAFWAWIYNYRAKEKGFVGNLMVAASVAIPYIYGGVSVGIPADILLWLMALTSLLASAGREVVKTISDVVGDQARKVRSVTLVHGPKVASSVGAAFFIAAVISSGLPVLWGRVGVVYEALVTIPVAIFSFATYKILTDHSGTNALYVKNLALAGMFTGLLAFTAGGVFRF